MPTSKYEFLLKSSGSDYFNIQASEESRALRSSGFLSERIDGLLVVDRTTEVRYSFEPPGIQIICIGNELNMRRAYAVACDVAYSVSVHQNQPVEVITLKAPASFDDDLPEPTCVSGNAEDLIAPNKELFIRAMRSLTDGSILTACDRCGTPIVFSDINDGADAIKHHCSCGKYNGTLRR